MPAPGINYRQLRIEIDRQAPTAIYSKIKPLMVQEFETRKKRMLEEFEEHRVTQSLRAGAENPRSQDGIVSTANGGNLYSLIGFVAGEDPASAAREILEKDVHLNISQTKREVRQNVIEFKTPVRVPTLETFHGKIARILPLKWTSRAFTDLIERGITGLPWYIYDNLRRFNGKSRSGPAIQSKTGKLRGGSMRRIRYISQILANFRALIEGTKRGE